MPTEALPDVLTRLNERGFTDQCRADPEGIRFLRAGVVFPPEDLTVAEEIRLEGTSTPTEQTAVYALVSPNGDLRGSYTVPHGTEMDAIDADAVVRLSSNNQGEQVTEAAAPQPLQPQY